VAKKDTVSTAALGSGQTAWITEFDASAPALCEGIFGLPTSADQSLVVLVGAPWEATTSYGRGTAAAPQAILRASWQVDLFDFETERPYEQGIAMLPADPEIEAANAAACIAAAQARAAHGRADLAAEQRQAVAEVNRLSSTMNQRLEHTMTSWIDQRRIVGVIGGEHSCAVASIAAQARRHDGLGVLHFDAHADLREAYEGFTYSHASAMDRVLAEVPQVSKLVSVGLRDLCEEEQERIYQSGGRVSPFYDAAINAQLFAGEPFGRIAQQIAAELPQDVYVSFDIDALDPSLCPHTGTPVPGGLGFQQAIAIVAAVVRSRRRIVGFDLCEVAPGPDGSEWDANVGARVLYKLIGFALQSWGSRS